jgi:hypothetical protein
MVSKTLLMASGAAFVATRVILRNWGATQRECRTALPGDELVADPAVVVTRAVSIEASAAEVWSWLVQIGQDRGGLYSWLAVRPGDLQQGIGVHDMHDITRAYLVGCHASAAVPVLSPIPTMMI